jgi:hypothetical protein
MMENQAQFNCGRLKTIGTGYFGQVFKVVEINSRNNPSAAKYSLQSTLLSYVF